MAGIWDAAKHPRGFHGWFGHGTGHAGTSKAGSAAAKFARAAGKGHLHAKLAKPVAAEKPHIPHAPAVPKAAKKVAATTARAKMTAPTRTPAQHLEALRGMSHEKATAHAATLKGRELDAVLREVPGAKRSGLVAEKRARIVEHATGHHTPVPAARVARHVAPAAKPNLETRIRAAYAKLLGNPRPWYEGGDEGVALHELRAELSDVPRAELDKELMRLAWDDPTVTDVLVNPQSYGRTHNTQRRLDAALMVGGHEQNIISIEGVRPSTTPKAAAPAASALAKPATARTRMAKPLSSRLANTATPNDAVNRLRGMTDRTQAEAYLAKATKSDLLGILGSAGSTGHRKGDTKETLRRHLVENLVGRRLDSEAIARGGGGGFAPSGHAAAHTRAAG